VPRIHSHHRAFAALASYALFHLVTVFPLSWIRLYSHQSIPQFLGVQMFGAGTRRLGIIASGKIAIDMSAHETLGTLASHDRGVQRVRPHAVGRGPRWAGHLHPPGFSLWAFPTGSGGGC